MTEATIGAAEAPVDSVPLSVEESAPLEVASEVKTGGGVLSVEVFDSGKCIFLDHEFTNFDSFVDVSDDDC